MVRLPGLWCFSLSSAPTVGNPCRPLQPEIVSHVAYATGRRGRAVIPILAGIDGTPVLSRAQAIETLARQTAQTILWHACLDGLREAGRTVLLELGPGADL